MTRRRKKQLMIISLVLVVGIGLFIFLNREKETRIISQDQIEAVEALTMEEKLEDFEYLHSFIEGNYPLLKVKERVNGIDWLGEKENFRRAIENASTDEMFIGELEEIIERLNDPYTNLIGMNTFKNYYAFYTEPEHEENYGPWAEILRDEKIIKRYRFDESQLKQIAPPTSDEAKESTFQYCQTDIIVPNEIAYLKIYRMNTDRVERDRNIIRDFIREVKEYDKLIIDIRQMGGWVGDDNYWIKNIVEPIISKDLSTNNYILMRGDNGKSFYGHKGMNFLPLTQMEELQKLNEELKINFDYYYIQNKTINPVEPIGFDGEIYVLISDKVIYTGENFAAFCKDSGFATLVGETTSGINYTLDNLFFSLPNSGLLVDMRGLISLNNDGTIRQEVNILPDIEVDATIGPTYERDQAIQYIINN